MKLLITGSAGYIGAVVTLQALLEGHHVTGVDALWYDNFSAVPRHPNHKFLHTDIRSVAEAELRGHDAVLHFAGFSNDPTADASPLLNQEVNVDATEELAIRAINAGVKHFTFASSASIYDGVRDSVWACETDRVAPIGNYSVSKYDAELALKRLTTFGWYLTVFRQGTVYGTSPRMRFDLVVNAMIRDAIVNKKITVHRPGTQRRPLTSVPEVARAHLWAITRPQPEPTALFNVVGTNVDIKGLANTVVHTLVRETGIASEVVYGIPPGRVRDYAVSGGALRDACAVWRRDALQHHIGKIGRWVKTKYDLGEDLYLPQYENIAMLKTKGRVA